MSKFFDLFEGINRGRDPFETRGEKRRAVFPQTGAYRSEIENAVMQLYLDPAAPAPHVTVFLALEPGTRSRWVCAHVGDLLASARPASVCLVEAAPARTSLREPLGLPELQGLTDLLADEELDLNRAVAQVPESSLWLLTFGSTCRNGDLLRSELLHERINQMRRRFDFILVDAACTRSWPSAFALARLADGVVLVLEAGMRRERVLQWKEELDSAGVAILGAILMHYSLPIPEAISKRL